jgi:hypothetical protein
MEHLGQVHLQTPFGSALFSIARDTSYTTFLEVGTWKGFGTTLCIVEGLLQRIKKENTTNIHFYSVESNKTFYNEAVTNWNRIAMPFLHLCYGKLHTKGLLSKEEIVAHPLFENVKTHFQLWYDQDVIDYNQAPFIDPALLPQIDVLILDGGEFSGYADWQALKTKKPMVVCLDDVFVMKNEAVYKELSSAPEDWTILTENNDRHGWAIFCRKKPYE